MKIVQYIRKNLALWSIIISLALMFIGFIVSTYTEVWGSFVLSASASLFAASIVSYFVDKKVLEITHCELEKLIKERFPKLLEFERLGLKKVIYTNDLHDIKVDIISPSELFIVMNDGKNFFTNNQKDLKRRFESNNKKTIVILMSPSSDSAGIMDRRNDKEKDGQYYARKITDSIASYSSIHSQAGKSKPDPPESNHLIIYEYPYDLRMSIVATDKIAIVGAYRNSGIRSIPPHFVFEDRGRSCEYNNIREDIEKLIDRKDIKRLIERSTKCDKAQSDTI